MKHWLFISLVTALMLTFTGYSGGTRPLESREEGTIPVISGDTELTPGQEWSNNLGMEFVSIPAGTFMMGSPGSEANRKLNERQHRVSLTKGFWLGKYEVTQGEWREVMGSNPSEFSNCGSNCPVEKVSCSEVQEFIRWLNQRDSLNLYRLPTEAEWEYAARAGSTTAYCFGNDAGRFGEYGWYRGNSGSRTHPVGQKKPNNWGLYDMHGNVWEWVEDWLGVYPGGSVTDPKGPSSGWIRLSRGGGWGNYAWYCRSAYRLLNDPGLRGRAFGFRLLRTPR